MKGRVTDERKAKHRFVSRVGQSRIIGVGAVLSVALGLCACATTGADPNFVYRPSSPDESLALQVAKGANLVGLRDGDSPVDAKTASGRTNLPSAAVYGALNALSPPMGFGPWGAGLLAFASHYESASPEYATWHNQFLVWMPKELAASDDEALHKIEAMFTQVMNEAVAETPMPAGYRIEPKPVEKPLNINVKKPSYIAFQRTWPIHGGECDDPKVACGYKISPFIRPVERSAPQALGGYQAWGYGRPQAGVGLIPSMEDNREFREKYRARFPDYDVLKKVSERLPEWAFIYIAPQRVSHIDESGEAKLIQYPMMLRQGKPLYFVKGQ